MFNFKKSEAGVPKQEDFECECCGSMENQASTGPSSCGSGCGSTNNSCCVPTEDKTSTGSSGCSSGCGPTNNSCCGGK